MARSAWRLPGYRVEELLGTGSSGEVWLGRVNSTGRGVALKRIWLSNVAQRRAALSEAAMLKALDHPHLMKLHEVRHVGDDAIVLVLDLASGGSLASLLARRGRLTVGEVITAVAPIGAALAYAEHSGIVHGDVSAANILFTDIGLPLLADLGVSRLLGSALPVRTTPAYVDPLVAGGAMPTAASDVFMLGAVALHALTGTPPWPGNVPLEVLEEAAYGEPPDFEAQLTAAGVPSSVASPVLRALTMEPAQRGTAADFALDLRHAATPVAVELSAGRARIAPTLRSEAGAQVGELVGSWPLESVRVEGSADADRSRPVVGPSRAVGGDRTGAGAGPVPGQGAGREDPGVPFVGEQPLTYGVRAPSPFAPLPGARHLARSRHRLASGLAAAAVVVAVVVAAAVWWPARQGHSTGAAAGAPTPSQAAGSPVARSPRASVPVPVPVPVPATITTAQAGGVLASLDAVRSRAFADRDPALLSGVYASAPLLARDRALLTSIVPAGCGLRGVRTRFGDLTIVTRAPDLLRVHVRAVVGASTLVCAGTASGRAAAAPAVAMQVDLVRRASGYRIAAQRRG